MSTPTVTPIVTQIPALSWLQRHERIILVVLVLLAGCWAYGKYADASASKAETRAAVAEQALASQKDADAKNEATTASVLAQYQAMVTTQSAQISSLAALAASRQATVVKNQATDATLALPLLAGRLQTLGNVPEGQVSTDLNRVNITQTGAVAVVQTLETIPALQADLKDTQTALAGAESAQAKAGEVIDDQGTQIAGLKLTVVDEEKSCTAQISAVKTEARKGKIKWFKVGFVTGFITRQVIKTYTGF
jgi:hypothetical protein